MIAWVASFQKDCAIMVKTNKCSTNVININIKISYGLSILLILYLFYNADLLKICFILGLQIISRRTIDNTVLLSTNSNIVENFENLKEVHWLCMNWATKYISKFDLSKD